MFFYRLVLVVAAVITSTKAQPDIAPGNDSTPVHADSQVEHSSEAAASVYDQSRYPSCCSANCQNEQPGSDWPERENSFYFYNPFGREQHLPAYIMFYETKSRNICMHPITDLNVLIGDLEGLRAQEIQRKLWHPQDTETNFYIPVVKNSYG